MGGRQRIKADQALQITAEFGAGGKAGGQILTMGGRGHQAKQNKANTQGNLRVFKALGLRWRQNCFQFRFLKLLNFEIFEILQ